MRNYYKKESFLYEFYDGTNFKLTNTEINNHIMKVLNELEKSLNKDNINDSQYINIKSKFIERLINMPVSLFENSYISMIAFIDLSIEEQKTLLKSLDNILNLNIFSSDRIVNKTLKNGKVVDEYTYIEHKYEISDIIRFFMLFKTKIDRYIDNSIVKYLKMNKVDKEITFDEQIMKINQYIQDSEDINSDINKFIIKEFNNLISTLGGCFNEFCQKNVPEVLNQVKEVLKGKIIEKTENRDKLINTYLISSTLNQIEIKKH